MQTDTIETIPEPELSFKVSMHAPACILCSTTEAKISTYWSKCIVFFFVLFCFFSRSFSFTPVKQFLYRYNLFFSEQPLMHSSDRSHIAFIRSLCIEKATAWSPAISITNPALLFRLSKLSLLKCVVILTTQLKATKPLVSFCLLSREGVQCLSTRLIFTYWQQRVGGVKNVLQGVFLKGLSEEITDELAVWD